MNLATENPTHQGISILVQTHTIRSCAFAQISKDPPRTKLPWRTKGVTMHLGRLGFADKQLPIFSHGYSIRKSQPKIQHTNIAIDVTESYPSSRCRL